MPLAPAGKELIARSMYLKGKAFIGAAILVRLHDDSEHVDYVFLHLLCQGVEIVLKGLLLLKDYDKYRPRLRRPLGHNLHKIAREAAAAYLIKPMRKEIDAELLALSKLYSDHLLRYGGLSDIFIDPRSIPRVKVFRLIYAVIRLAEREIMRKSATK